MISREFSQLSKNYRVRVARVGCGGKKTSQKKASQKKKLQKKASANKKASYKFYVKRPKYIKGLN